jgi:hypothetical protein
MSIATGISVIGGRESASVVISSGASLSAAMTLGGWSAIAIQTPATFEPTTLTFQGSIDGGVTFANIYDDAGTEVAWTVAVSRMVAPATPLIGYDQIKIRGGTSGSPTTVAADRTLTVLIRYA